MYNIRQLTDLFNDSEKSGEYNGKIINDEKLSSRTSMNTGGCAKLFLEPADEKSLIFSVKKLLSQNTDFFLLGGGSNLVISDQGLDVVISTRAINKIKILNDDNKKKDSDDFLLQIESGAGWAKVINFCKKENLSGFESFTGLSGSAGGALFMNASCFGLSACDNLVKVTYFDTEDLTLKDYDFNSVHWGYKKSPFQNQYMPSGEDLGALRGLPAERGVDARNCGPGERLLPSKIIISAVFRLKKGFDEKKSESVLQSRREKGHFRAPSSGSAFKNDPEKGIVAGKIIDECELKGLKVGGAQIAPWHGNFIINPERKATGADVKNLSMEVKKIVMEKKGIELESEIIFVGNFS